MEFRLFPRVKLKTHAIFSASQMARKSKETGQGMYAIKGIKAMGGGNSLAQLCLRHPLNPFYPLNPFKPSSIRPVVSTSTDNLNENHLVA